MALVRAVGMRRIGQRYVVSSRWGWDVRFSGLRQATRRGIVAHEEGEEGVAMAFLVGFRG